MEKTAVAPLALPSAEGVQEHQHERLFHVVLLDDNEHSYEYVIEMLQSLFFFSLELALQHAVEVDLTGRTIVVTCERPQAEYGRDQIHGYGADPRIPKCKGSMSAVLIPVGDPVIVG